MCARGQLSLCPCWDVPAAWGGGSHIQRGHMWHPTGGSHHTQREPVRVRLLGPGQGRVCGGRAGVWAGAFAPGADGGRSPGPRASSSTGLRAEGGTAAFGNPAQSVSSRGGPNLSLCCQSEGADAGRQATGATSTTVLGSCAHRCRVLSLPPSEEGFPKGLSSPVLWR